MISIISWFANILGYLLNFLYNMVNNYGLAIILFSIIIKLILLPISFKQQKTMKKSAKIQKKINKIQEKYKNNKDKLNEEVFKVYKEENMSPLSGCLSSIAQIIILFAVFYLVRSPLTYMKKIETEKIEKYKEEIIQEQSNSAYPEISIIRNKGDKDESIYINMNFLGINLSNIPNQNFGDIKVYVIPILYVISSIISVKLTTNVQGKKKEKNDEEKENEIDTMTQANKSMTMMMPIMAVSISMIAPLGLALYWLVNNVLMILERVILNKYFDSKEIEEENINE